MFQVKHIRRCRSLDNAVYLARHIRLTHQRVEGLAALEWNAVASPIGAVNTQDGAKDEVCVRMTSIKLNQDACTGRKWNTNVRWGWASSHLRTSADQCELTGSRIRWIGLPTGVCSSSMASSSQNSRERCWRRTMPHTWPSFTRNPASRSTVPLRLYSNSRRAGRARAGGRRGTGGWSGAVGRRTPMPGFSSTQNSGPSVGGLSSNSMIVTALVANSGSRSFIQVLKTVQANLVTLENDADGALAGMAQAEFGMSGHVLRQVVDAPVGLPGSRRINLGRLLAGQHEQSSLDVSVVQTWRWALGMVLEAIQALLGEPMAPHKDGAHRQSHLLRNGRVGLIGGDTQDDLGTIGILLGRGAGGHAALKCGAFGGQQTNTSTTGSGARHVRRSFRYFRLQPARLHMNSIPTSTNRKR